MYNTTAGFVDKTCPHYIFLIWRWAFKDLQKLANIIYDVYIHRAVSKSDSLSRFHHFTLSILNMVQAIRLVNDIGSDDLCCVALAEHRWKGSEVSRCKKTAPSHGWHWHWHWHWHWVALARAAKSVADDNPRCTTNHLSRLKILEEPCKTFQKFVSVCVGCNSCQSLPGSALSIEEWMTPYGWFSLTLVTTS